MFKRLTSFIKNDKGQETVEFVLLLGVIASLILLLFSMFHKQLAGGLFTIIGKILT